MADLLVCTQHDVMPDTCPCCGGWLHAEQRGGFPGPSGWYCSEECAAAEQARIEQGQRWHHLNTRDLLCDCEVCSAAGHPTAAELAEWDECHRAVRDG